MSNNDHPSPCRSLPPLTEARVLRLADAHRRRTGCWPRIHSGPVEGLDGLTWRQVDAALRYGRRGLPGGSSLPQLLADRRGAHRWPDLPPLSESDVVAWARAHHQTTGGWPTADTGTVTGRSGETWRSLDMAIRQGRRGLSGGSLSKLLDEHVGPRPVAGRATLTAELILAWADRHKGRTGGYPHAKSGPVAGAPGETWHHIDSALRRGYRGLPGNDTLARLLRRHG
jgi:hypothetical protein